MMDWGSGVERFERSAEYETKTTKPESLAWCMPKTIGILGGPRLCGLRPKDGCLGSEDQKRESVVVHGVL